MRGDALIQDEGQQEEDIDQPGAAPAGQTRLPRRAVARDQGLQEQLDKGRAHRVRDQHQAADPVVAGGIAEPVGEAVKPGGPLVQVQLVADQDEAVVAQQPRDQDHQAGQGREHIGPLGVLPPRRGEEPPPDQPPEADQREQEDQLAKAVIDRLREGRNGQKQPLKEKGRQPVKRAGDQGKAVFLPQQEEGALVHNDLHRDEKRMILAEDLHEAQRESPRGDPRLRAQTPPFPL